MRSNRSIPEQHVPSENLKLERDPFVAWLRSTESGAKALDEMARADYVPPWERDPASGGSAPASR